MWKMRPMPATSAMEALAILRQAFDRQEPFPLVITDCHMPGIDGFGLAERIRKALPAEPAIMMLTSGEKGCDIPRCRALGISHFIAKPVRRGELRQAILKALGRVPAAAAAPSESAKKSEGARILLAEDNLINQRVATRILEKHGHAVTVAENGLEALRAFGKTAFDVVLIDVQMPEMDGFEATAAIREIEKSSGGHIPIIAMTAHAMTGDRERCLASGMDDYIPKPIRAQALLNLIEVHSAHRPASPPS